MSRRPLQKGKARYPIVRKNCFRTKLTAPSGVAKLNYSKRITTDYPVRDGKIFQVKFCTN